MIIDSVKHAIDSHNKSRKAILLPNRYSINKIKVNDKQIVAKINNVKDDTNNIKYNVFSNISTNFIILLASFG